MPKAKRAKTSHRDLNRPMTQEEIWDDSALIRSWDDAVKEYEFYHSIHAKGEDVEEVLRRAEMEDDEGEVADQAEAPVIGPSLPKQTSVAEDLAENGGDEVEDGEVEEVDEAVIRGEESIDRQKRINRREEVEKVRAVQLSPVDGGGSVKVQSHVSQPPLDKEVPVMAGGDAAGPARDQTLENIKMSYWWAGYYSGLYEGQKKAGHR